MQLKVTYKGIRPLILANPQTVDRFNPYARRMAAINAKKTNRTDDDYRELADLEVRSRSYWNDDTGVYVPGRWVLASIAQNSNAIAKVSKLKIRGSLFVDQETLPLTYAHQNKVKTIDDIVGNEVFRLRMILPQKGVRVAKSMPHFLDWSFSANLTYDEKTIDPDQLEAVIKYSAERVGFGDFRPTFGRCTAEVTHV